MKVDVEDIRELNAMSLTELIKWTESAMDRLRVAKQSDTTGLVESQFNYWKHCRSAFNWALHHNGTRRWSLIIEKRDKLRRENEDSITSS
jgi:hypothetical protein